MDFWKNVDICLREQNTSYRYLSDRTGLKESTISMMRARKTEPRASDAVVIASALNTTVEYLSKGENTTTISAKEFEFLQKCRPWREVIERMNSIDPEFADKIVAMVMAVPASLPKVADSMTGEFLPRAEGE